jgi:hypothetical protein
LLFIGSTGILLTGVLWLYFCLLVIMPGPRVNNNFMLFFLFIFLAFMEIGGAVAGFKLIQELRKRATLKVLNAVVLVCVVVLNQMTLLFTNPPSAYNAALAMGLPPLFLTLLGLVIVLIIRLKFNSVNIC